MYITLWLTLLAALDTESSEASLERARAARRAAAAAVKFVASSATLASLEPVNLETLTSDEKSKSRLLLFVIFSFWESYIARLYYLLQQVWHQKSRWFHRAPSAFAKVQAHLR